ncbi:hypothetical protein [Rubritalea tangerina]|uniref:hypothetical protein n=1 Tax=Rubritalea tangerina TaxID=430798 RepID=UPI0036100591
MSSTQIWCFLSLRSTPTIVACFGFVFISHELTSNHGAASPLFSFYLFCVYENGLSLLVGAVISRAVHGGSVLGWGIEGLSWLGIRTCVVCVLFCGKSSTVGGDLIEYNVLVGACVTS